MCCTHAVWLRTRHPQDPWSFGSSVRRMSDAVPICRCPPESIRLERAGICDDAAVRGASIGPGVDIKNRGGERFWCLLRKIVTCIRHDAVLMASREAL